MPKSDLDRGCVKTPMSLVDVEVPSPEQLWLHQRAGISRVLAASYPPEYSLRRRLFYPLRLALCFHPALTKLGPLSQQVAMTGLAFAMIWTAAECLKAASGITWKARAKHATRSAWTGDRASRVERSRAALPGQPPSMKPRAAMAGTRASEAHQRSLRRRASSAVVQLPSAFADSQASSSRRRFVEASAASSAAIARR